MVDSIPPVLDPRWQSAGAGRQVAVMGSQQAAIQETNDGSWMFEVRDTSSDLHVGSVWYTVNIGGHP